MATSQPLPPSLLQALFSLKNKLDATGFGKRNALVNSFAAQICKRPSTVYRWLSTHTDFTSSRKVRSDCGKTKIPDETLNFIAGVKREGVRGNGKATMPTCVAMNIAAANGLSVSVSKSRFNAVMRQHKLDVKTVSAARNTKTMRSLYPNHVHQIDPSLCLIFYMGGKQKIMRDEEFYKNKLENIAKVKLKVWRYVCYDHFSGRIDVRYFEAAGENQQSLFDFLLYTWGKQPNRLSYGKPTKLLWDKGSANTGHGVTNMLDALGVEHETHFAGHAWAKGGVEQGNNLVETHFESRLKLEPVETCAQLNAAVELWARDYNANALAHIDSRIRRESGEPLVRDDLWQLILQTPEYLVEMPSREVCAYFLHGAEKPRQVKNLQISFKHPELSAAYQYDLKPWAEYLTNGEQVQVVPLLMRQGAIRVEISMLGRAPLLVEIDPPKDFDAAGRNMAAQVIGEGYSRAKETAGERAAKQLLAAAYGDGVNMDDADKLRAKQTKPFAHMNNGKGVVAHSHLGKAELPSRILPNATELQTAQITAAKNTRIETAPLSLAEACKFIKGIQGASYKPATYAWLSARFADGKIPQEYAEAMAYGQAQMQATGTDHLTPTPNPTLRSVK